MQTISVNIDEYLFLVERDNEVTLFRGEDYLPTIEGKRLVLYNRYGARQEVEVNDAPYME